MFSGFPEGFTDNLIAEASGVISGLAPLATILGAIILGFFIIEFLLSIIEKNIYQKRHNRLMREAYEDGVDLRLPPNLIIPSERENPVGIVDLRKQSADKPWITRKLIAPNAVRKVEDIKRV
jgi:hypothetical protein